MSKTDELYIAQKEIFDKEYDLNVSPIPKIVVLKKVRYNPATGKYEDVQKKNMAYKEKEVDDFITSGVATQTGMKNYYLDPFGLDYTEVDGKKIPNTGLRPPYGKMTIECVSPFTKGASAVGGHGKPQSYWEGNGVTTTTDFREATDTKRLWSVSGSAKVFGIGGLGNPTGLGRYSDWGGNKSNGHIFKIVSPPTDNVAHSWIDITDSKTLSQFAQVGRVTPYPNIRLRAWIYVEKGYVGFGNHSGYQGDIRLPEGHKNRFEAKEEWQFVDVEFTSNHGTPLNRGIAIGTDYSVDLEMYMAAPLLTVSTGNASYIA